MKYKVFTNPLKTRKIMSKKLFLLSVLVFSAAILITACKKKHTDEPLPNPGGIQIVSFTSSKTTMFPFDTATVTMVATGDDLNYLWFSDKGTIVPTSVNSVIKFTA